MATTCVFGERVSSSGGPPEELGKAGLARLTAIVVPGVTLDFLERQVPGERGDLVWGATAVSEPAAELLAEAVRHACWFFLAFDHPMTRQAGGVASLTKPPIESRLVERLAVLGRQERIAVNAYHVAGGDGLGERRMDRHVYLHAGLDLFNGEHVVDDAMPSQLADIAATLAGVEEK